jgi:hypothetical protein
VTCTHMHTLYVSLYLPPVVDCTCASLPSARHVAYVLLHGFHSHSLAPAHPPPAQLSSPGRPRAQASGRPLWHRPPPPLSPPR